MPDEVDIANDQIQAETDALVQRAARPISPGNPGDCELCGEWFGRLINGACAPCRDRYKLP